MYVMTSNTNPCLHKFDIKSVFAKQTPGVKTPPDSGSLSVSLKIVVADNKIAVVVAPYPNTFHLKF